MTPYLKSFLPVVALLGAVAVPSTAAAQNWGGQPAPGAQPAPGTPAPGAQPYGGGFGGGATPDAAQQQQQQELDRSRQADSGRGLKWFYFDVEGGYQYVGLQTFEANQLVDSEVVKTDGNGWYAGAGAGLQLLFLTVGPRFRYSDVSDYQLWSLNLEGGFRFPIGPLEPHFTVGGGYTNVGSFSPDQLNSDAVDIQGPNVRVGGGLDFFLTNWLTIGAKVSWEMMFLSRPGTDPVAAVEGVQGAGDVMNMQDAEATGAAVYEADGSSIGSALNIGAVLSARLP